VTQTAGAGLNKADRAAALSWPARQVHLAVLAAFARTGQPPGLGELGRIAQLHGADPAAVLAELAERDVIAFGEDGEIRAAYPFSPAHTPIQVSWEGGPTAYAMCAIDALGISAMLGRPVMITATEPGTGRTITVHANRDQARWHPRSAVVFAGAADVECSHAADRSCGYINFFTSKRAARAWGQAHPTVTGKVMNQARSLGWGVAEFGGFMRTSDATSRS
jgi:alkylmercury lyase-like protein